MFNLYLIIAYLFFDFLLFFFWCVQFFFITSSMLVFHGLSYFHISMLSGCFLFSSVGAVGFFFFSYIILFLFPRSYTGPYIYVKKTPIFLHMRGPMLLLSSLVFLESWVSRTRNWQISAKRKQIICLTIANILLFNVPNPIHLSTLVFASVYIGKRAKKKTNEEIKIKERRALLLMILKHRCIASSMSMSFRSAISLWIESLSRKVINSSIYLSFLLESTMFLSLFFCQISYPFHLFLALAKLSFPIILPILVAFIKG